MISVFSDGASSGKPDRPGGFGWVIVKRDDVLLWGYGSNVSTTNNKMELSGAIAGLEALLANDLHHGDAVELVSDSEYVLGIANGRYHPTSNLDLTARLKKAVSQIKGLTFRWVHGHTGDKWNEKCDELAGLGKQEAKCLALKTP